MLGSILSNILLVLGCAFVGAGIKYKESQFQATAAQASASLMTLGCVGLVIPAAYHAGKVMPKQAVAALREGHTGQDWAAAMLDADEMAKSDPSAYGVLVISRGTAIVRRARSSARRPAS